MPSFNRHPKRCVALATTHRAIIFLIILLFTQSVYLHGQEDNYVGPEPSISLAEMAIHYYQVEWTDSQWNELRGKQLELSFLIDQIGEPFLRVVRGTSSEDIIDSLRLATQSLPYFQPATKDSATVESIYIFTMSFPNLQHRQAKQASTTLYFPPAMVDRELLESEEYQLAPMSLFLDLGFHANNHFGRVDEYLKPGGGMDMYFAFHFKNRWGFGGAMGVEYNGKNQLFPIDPLPNRQLDGAGGTYVGPLVEYTLRKTKKSDLALRGELAIASFFVASKLNPPDSEGFVSKRGLHAGAHLNYNLKLGRYGTSPSASDREVSGIYHGLNIYGGFRVRRYGYAPANAVYLFCGLGYRLGVNNLQKAER